MGFTEILTIIFVVAKITGFIDWSWWLVLLPEIIAGIIYIIILIIIIFAGNLFTKKLTKKFDKF